MRIFFRDPLTVWFSKGLDKWGAPEYSDAIQIWGRYERVSSVKFGNQGIGVSSDSTYLTDYPLRQPDAGWDDEWLVAIAQGHYPPGTHPEDDIDNPGTIKAYNEVSSISGRVTMWEIVK